jgi:hypothetical protein
VNAGGETRTFILYAVSAAPGGDLLLNIAGTNNRVLIDSTSTLFVNRSSCTGEELTTLTISMVNTGYHDFMITSADFYVTDTTYGQGRPRYPFRRDAQNNLIRSNDYVITPNPPVLPLTSAQSGFPIAVAQGQTRTIYLTFVSQRAEKRFARAYIYTNGQSRSGLNLNGVLTEGVLTFDLFGRGVSSSLSDNITGGLPKAISFPETKIGDSADATLHLFNPGICPLRISLPRMNITTGDIDEFSIVSLPTAGIDAATGDLILSPGANESVVLRFKPQTYGSRRAGLRLMTNDSTIIIPGITERGVYYLDLYGSGKADLYAEGVDFGSALIGGTGAEQIHKIVRVTNSLSKPLQIIGIIRSGADTADFQEDGAAHWPTLPITLNAGQELDLSVVFGPIAGQPGGRGADIKIVLSNGDTITAKLKGTAGTRTLSVNPTTLNLSVSAGKVARKTIMITNSGTMPIRLQAPSVAPLGSDFAMSPLARLALDPGQTEFLELSYSPQASGSVNAVLTIPNNGTTGAAQVTLNGVAKTKQVGVDPSALTQQGDIIGYGTIGRADDLSTSSAGSQDVTYGMALLQSVPNPAYDQVEIGYRLVNAGEVSLELYDGAGRLVKVLDAGTRLPGEQHVRVDVSGLASGVYHYRLNSGGHSISRSMTIAR